MLGLTFFPSKNCSTLHCFRVFDMDKKLILVTQLQNEHNLVSPDSKQDCILLKFCSIKQLKSAAVNQILFFLPLFLVQDVRKLRKLCHLVLSLPSWTRSFLLDRARVETAYINIIAAWPQLYILQNIASIIFRCQSNSNDQRSWSSMMSWHFSRMMIICLLLLV